MEHIWNLKEEIENNLKSWPFKKNNLMNNLLVNSKFRSILILVLMAILITTLPTVVSIFYIALTHKKLLLARVWRRGGTRIILKNIEKYIAIVSGIS